MNVEIREVVLLLIAVGVPLFLLLKKQEKPLLGWVGATMFVQIFDTAIITNLPTGRIVGLMYLPRALMQLWEWLKLKPVRAWLLNYGYLLLLGLVLGILWPWPDITMMRPVSLTSPGRTLVFSTRLLSDFSLALFVANQLRIPGRLFYLGRALLLGATLTAVAGIFYFYFKVDLYYRITGLGEHVLLVDRARGLSIEPRALGLACAYGIMAVLLGRKELSRLWPFWGLVNLVGLFVTYSASSFGLLVVGIITCSLFFTNRERAMVGGLLVLALLVIGWAYFYSPLQFQTALDTLQFRLDPDYKLSGIPPGNWMQELAYRLDVFDASALLFLLDKPVYALIGTGPGLVCLPASYYIPPGLYSNIWTAETGINSLPFHGWLLEVSNSGLLGIALWFVQVSACLTALRYLTRKLRQDIVRQEWRFGYALFVVGAVFYLVQVSSSPVWSLFLGLGWAATSVALVEMEKAREEAIRSSYERSILAPDWAFSQQRRVN